MSDLNCRKGKVFEIEDRQAKTDKILSGLNKEKIEQWIEKDKIN